MIGRWLLLVSLVVSLALSCPPAGACCPASREGRPVVNADQTVILIWDPATQTEHFIRRASFKADAEDFGFLIPSPSRPELNQSGDAAFGQLAAITAPPLPARTGGGCSCSASDMTAKSAGSVTLLEEKDVAGYHAQVLEATSAEALVAWLNERGYVFSPEVQEWARPYIEQGWKITALKIAKAKDAAGATQPTTQYVSASALRMSFKIDRPLFPYREPNPTNDARALGVSHRLLRIYFVSDTRYVGELTKENRWTGNTAWSNRLTPSARDQLLKTLNLPNDAAPANAWLTEFEDNWPYAPAPADLYFTRAFVETPVKRTASIGGANLAGMAGEGLPFAVVIALAWLLPRIRIKRATQN